MSHIERVVPTFGPFGFAQIEVVSRADHNVVHLVANDYTNYPNFVRRNSYVITVNQSSTVINFVRSEDFLDEPAQELLFSLKGSGGNSR